jgi:hypothetical protein
MAAGISEHVWEELIALMPMPKSAAWASKKRARSSHWKYDERVGVSPSTERKDHFQMSLALVQVPVQDFQFIHAHLTTYSPKRNMHLREMQTVKKQTNLRYLHAMHVAPGTNDIDGAISGPAVFWRYRIRLVAGRVQLQVLVQRSSAKDAARIQSHFLPEILKRVRQEKAGTKHQFPKLKAGRFYLRRWFPGMHHTHANCVAAVSSGTLDPAFVSQFQPWNFLLLHP